jgi:hypothetical protein
MPIYGENAGKFIGMSSVCDGPGEIENNLSNQKRNRGFGKGASSCLNFNNFQNIEQLCLYEIKIPNSRYKKLINFA